MAGRHERQQSGGFAGRLRQVVEAYGSASGLAKAIERSEGAVRKWLRSESEPNVTDLRAVCEQTRTSLEWIVTGRGPRDADAPTVRESAPPPYQNVNREPLIHSLLEAVIQAVDEELGRAALMLTPAKRAMLITALYGMSQERKEVDREAVVRLVKLAG